MRILIAEDERDLARALMRIFEKNGFSADAVHNGIDAMSYLELGNYDVAILDIMMPGLDGIAVLKRIRAKGIVTPVLLLSARSQVEDKVLGLDSGANYYLTKPFDIKELLATVRAITRTLTDKNNKLSFGDLTLDRTTFILSTEEKSTRLSNKEFQMMEMLLSAPHAVVPTERFMEKIWGYDNDVEINVVWVYISYLRKKVASLGSQVQIKASRNSGYSLEVAE